MKPQPVDLLGDEPKRKLSQGYAGHPGLGPAGETCGTCRYCRGHHYYKCHHERAFRSFSVATDIRKGTLACEFWEGR